MKASAVVPIHLSQVTSTAPYSATRSHLPLPGLPAGAERRFCYGRPEGKYAEDQVDSPILVPGGCL